MDETRCSSTAPATPANPAVAELFAQLEQASVGGEELDARVIAACICEGEALLSPFNGRWCVYTKIPDGGVRIWEPRGQRLSELRRALLDNRGPTRSVDAAMLLMPEGWGWFLDYMDPGEPDGAGVGPHTCDGSMDGMKVRPPALALCIAALKARLAVPQPGCSEP